MNLFERFPSLQAGVRGVAAYRRSGLADGQVVLLPASVAPVALESEIACRSDQPRKRCGRQATLCRQGKEGFLDRFLSRLSVGSHDQ